MSDMAAFSASDSDHGASAFIDEMCLYCHLQSLPSGSHLRVKGQHYRDMYLITHGECLVETDPGNSSVKPIVRGPGQPIGEIGYLRGLPATATVTASDDMQVMIIDDETLELLETRKPDLLASFLRHLSKIADDRTSYNLVLQEEGELDDRAQATEVLLCRNEDMLAEAQRLRFDIYCVELGRDLPYADSKKRIISDALDEFAHCFIAVLDGQVIGTIRANFAREGSLGSLEQLHGMPASPHYPDHSGICTNLLVRREHRGGQTAMQLVSHAAQFGLRHDIRECFIDCVPSLVHYYRAMGFRSSGEPFFHPENGPSVPLKLDLEKHGKSLSGEFGVKRMVQFYLKSRALKFADRLRG